MPVIRSTIHNLGSRTGPVFVFLCSCLTFLSNQFRTIVDIHSTQRCAGDVNTATFCRSGLVCTSPPSPIDLQSWVNLVKYIANVLEVVLVGVEETARVATGSIWVTISVTIWVTGDVDIIAADSSGRVSTVDPAVCKAN